MKTHEETKSDLIKTLGRINRIYEKKITELNRIILDQEKFIVFLQDSLARAKIGNIQPAPRPCTKYNAEPGLRPLSEIIARLPGLSEKLNNR